MSLYLYLFVAVIYLIYKWGTRNNNFFIDHGIPYIKPMFLIGSNTNLITKKYALSEQIIIWYNKFYDEKVFGLFEGTNPLIVIKDPALIKQIGVKDFEYFMNHRKLASEQLDPLFAKALLFLQDQKWKDMRSTLSPAFTGSKMRLMFDLVIECAGKSTKTLKEQIQKSDNNVHEMKELFTKFTVDMIATCAFGLEVNSFENPENEFAPIRKVVDDFNKPQAAFKMLGFGMFPKLMEFFKIRLMDKPTCDVFQDTIKETIKIREERNILRHDMINLLMEANKGQLSHGKSAEDSKEGFAMVEESAIGKARVDRVWDDEDMAAQAFIFFFAGFDATSASLSLTAYHLAINPEVQEKLFYEIQHTEIELGGKILTYDVLQKLKYMDQVICETLRLWTIAPFINRLCSKDFTLKYDDKAVTIKKDTMIWFPVSGLHRDPKYFPNPEKFDPERFSEKNKSNINTEAYLPFGIGPRNCIGSRFALMVVKTMLYHMLFNFSFEVTGKTRIPLILEKLQFADKVKDGIWVGLKPRE